MKRISLIVLAATVAALMAATTAIARTDQEKTVLAPSKSGYAPVNGVEIYYEIYGEGKPLVLLHGGFESIEMFAPIMPILAAGRQVIAVDLQGHGRTLPFERPMTFANMATDVAGLIRYLGFEKADVMGDSLGGSTALRLALDHPEVIDKLILVSTPYAFSGWHEFNAQGMKHIAAEPGKAAEELRNTPLYESYAAIAPDAGNWDKLVEQTGRLLGQEYDWSNEVRHMQMPTLLIAGDWDAVRTSHTVKFFELLGGGLHDALWDGSGMNANRLAILPGLTHYTIFTDPRLAETATAFLDAPAR
ncbi:MAG: alpha/beta hydrolase [Woeseiaceae bacterium]